MSQKEDTIRVLRVLEYIGPRSRVEAIIDRSIHGAKRYGGAGEEVTIRGATIGTYPEILEEKANEPSSDSN